ncbi:RNA polymerase sigma factor [Coralloluteibacterium thermophilus]|uniref:RNA polymerase sigma factor n=1 Tax=Coralloluteibacterium thermophilum TaxID=2707049 RepID=A0ABV9NHB6_9GAMM
MSSAFAIDVPGPTLAAARAGDVRAYERIYRLFERPVFTLALRMTGSREDAQDVLQETMLKLFARLGDFRGQCPFWGWLRQIAVNESLMRLRRRARRDDDEALPEEPGDEAPDTLPPAAADAALLARALARLPPTTRSVLWLYHAEGFTHEEIAAAMARSVSFSKSQLARGTRRLRALLGIEEPSHA